MFYIYNRATSAIESNPTRGKHYLKAEYKTMGAARAAMTRMHKKFETNRFELLASKYSFERDRDEAKAENSPLYISGDNKRPLPVNHPCFKIKCNEQCQH